MKLKKGDKVVVIAGKARGQTGAIARVLPLENKIVVEGINVVKRYRRPTRMGESGSMIDKHVPIHASNVMLADPKTGKPTRIKISRKDGARVRVATKSGQDIT